MRGDWLSEVITALAGNRPIARLVILSVKGSAPREAGAEMTVMDSNTAPQITGTIGGGALEYEVIHYAHQLLGKLPQIGFVREIRDFALGPDLGQCCGGHVRLLFEWFTPACLPELKALQAQSPVGFYHDLNSQNLPQAIDSANRRFFYDKAKSHLITGAFVPATPLYIYGAGHVGQALINVTNALHVARIWVDSAKERFPENVPSDVMLVPAPDMSVVASHAPKGAFHIILTYSHQFDEAITYALLAKNDFGQIGLIGSGTKRARFAKRFREVGLEEAVIDRLQCPVGLSAITDKSPPHVALSIAGQIALWLEQG